MANSLMGWYLLNFENDWSGAARHFERSVEAAPTDSSILSNAIVMLNVLGRMEQAIELYEYAIERDPLNQQSMQNLAAAYLDAGRMDEAISMARQAIEMNPNAYSINAILGRAWLQKGDPERAADAFRQEPSEMERELGLAMAAHAAARGETFERRRDAWLQRWGDQYPAKAARLLAFAGSDDRAIEWLGMVSPGSMNDSLWQPEFDPLRDDPRWHALLERLDLTPEQREAIEFEVDVPET